MSLVWTTRPARPCLRSSGVVTNHRCSAQQTVVGPVQSADPEDLAAPLRVDAEHRRGKTVRADNEIANPQRSRCSGNPVGVSTSRSTGCARPRMKASGATSITPRSRCWFHLVGLEHVVRASKSGAGRVHLRPAMSPGRKTGAAGLDGRPRQHDAVPPQRRDRAATAIATARNDLPVPAGPTPTVIVERPDGVHVALLVHGLRGRP